MRFFKSRTTKSGLDQVIPAGTVLTVGHASFTPYNLDAVSLELAPQPQTLEGLNLAKLKTFLTEHDWCEVKDGRLVGHLEADSVERSIEL